MQEVKLDSWHEFKLRLERYLTLSSHRRRQIIFRGQADANWSLRPTLDRLKSFGSLDERKSNLERLLNEFERESLSIPFDLDRPIDPIQWELLGRHHGLPTTILDWTQSPYVAAFFSFADSASRGSRSVAIWALDLDVLVQQSPEGIDVMDDIDSLRTSRRAINQRAVFLRLYRANVPLESALDQFVAKYVIPASEKIAALNDLDQMMINARTLFLDLDAAAETARWRILDQEGD